MPHTSSAKKRLRQTRKRNARNRADKKALKIQVKKFLATLAGNDLEASKKEFNALAKKIDKLGSKRVIHPNTAARKKSLYARKLHAKLTKPVPAAPSEA